MSKGRTSRLELWIKEDIRRWKDNGNCLQTYGEKVLHQRQINLNFCRLFNNIDDKLDDR